MGWKENGYWCGGEDEWSDEQLSIGQKIEKN